MDSLKSKLDIRYKLLGVLVAIFILILGGLGTVPRTYNYMPMNYGMFDLQQFLNFLLVWAIKIFTFLFLLSLGFGSYYYYKKKATIKVSAGLKAWIDKFLGNDLTCQNCHKQINNEFKYCPNCKTNLERICPKCNEKLLNDWQCCPYCGEEK